MWEAKLPGGKTWTVCWQHSLKLVLKLLYLRLVVSVLWRHLVTDASASVFLSAEGETSRSFLMLNNYLWVTLKIQGARQQRGRKGKKPTDDTCASTDVGHIKQEQQWRCSKYPLPISFLKENQGDENNEQLLDGQETVALMSANGQLGSCWI